MMKKSASGKEGLTVKTRDFLIKSEAIQTEYVPENILVQHPSKTSKTVLDVVTEQNSTEDEYRNRKTYKKREIKDQAKQSNLS